MFSCYSFVDGAHAHGERPQWSAYLVGIDRDTFENWRSEFLQLLWQVVGLTYFLYMGPPSSKENEDRTEARLDAIIRFHEGARAEDIVADIDRRLLRAKEHAQLHEHAAERAAAQRLTPRGE